MPKNVRTPGGTPSRATTKSTASNAAAPLARDPEKQFEFVLHAVSRSLLRVYNAHFRALGLTSNEAGVLLQLDWTGLHTQTEIADSLGIGKAATGALIMDLESRGLLQRQRSAEDGRRIEVTLTRKGGQMADEINRQVQALGPGIQEGISDGDLKFTLSILSKVRANIQKIRDEGTLSRAAGTGESD